MTCGVCIRDDGKAPATCFGKQHGLSDAELLGACRAEGETALKDAGSSCSVSGDGPICAASGSPEAGTDAETGTDAEAGASPGTDASNDGGSDAEAGVPQ
ncbi:MAG: hypothetical protein H6718_16365 [Polyangiaceae bacterium]|nr:hypothetical protein [Myxococcales bacterium]MCB9586974.1 hypothetical protein [Polyangiaceae bacterium]